LPTGGCRCSMPSPAVDVSSLRGHLLTARTPAERCSDAPWISFARRRRPVEQVVAERLIGYPPGGWSGALPDEPAMPPAWTEPWVPAGRPPADREGCETGGHGEFLDLGVSAVGASPGGTAEGG